MAIRAEKTIQLPDREVRVLYTNRALAEAEKITGKSILFVAKGFADQTSGVEDLASLLRAGMEAARRDAKSGTTPITQNDAYAVLDEAGFSVVAESVITAIAEVLSFGGHESKN